MSRKFLLAPFLAHLIMDTPTLQATYVIRPGRLDDRPALMELYKTVTRTCPETIAREEDEITDAYIDGMVIPAVTQEGIMVVAEHVPTGQLIGSFIKCKGTPRVFNHVLKDGSIIVHPDHQGKGIGRALLTALLEKVRTERSDIKRIELMVRKSNAAARRLYESVGFQAEGELIGRVKRFDGTFDADIPMAWVRQRLP